MITIDESVKILKELKRHPIHKGNAYHKAAVGLGLEALKDLKNIRQTFPLIDFGRLPGETKTE